MFSFFLKAKEKPKLPDKYEKWIKEEVVYIIAPQEKEVFYKLKTDRERDLFIEEFWRQRDPTPGTAKNEFKEEHHRRIEYANREFGRYSSRLGWMTDRGRIYIILGKPIDIQKYSMTQQTYPMELWFYQGNPKFGTAPFFRLLFYQKYSLGEYRLYNPMSDGPKALVPKADLGGWFDIRLLNVPGDHQPTEGYVDKRDRLAIAVIQEIVSAELAQAAWSYIPGNEGPNYRMPSLILLSNINNSPQKIVDDDYAYEFLENKEVIEVSYSVNYIENKSVVKVIQDKSGLFFVHYSIEPETLSVNTYQDKYFSDIKLSLRVTDLKEKTIYQYQRLYPIEMTKEQLKKVKLRPYIIQDLFPLVPGNYRLNLLLQNLVSKEFTSFEKDIIIPVPNSLQMSFLILSNRVIKNSEYKNSNKAFQFGSIQIYPSSHNNFFQKDKLFIFFQIYGLPESIKESGILKFTFYKDHKILNTITKNIREYTNKQYFLEEFSLDKFSPSRYTMKVTLLDQKGNQMLSEKEEFSVSSRPLSQPWIISKEMPSAPDALYYYIMGIQYLNKGAVEDARDEFKKAHYVKPDSIEYALSYAKVLLALREYKKTKECLLPFLNKPIEKFVLYKFLGNAHQGLEKYEEAISYYKEYISHEGATFEILNSIALCYYQLGNEKQALQAWEKSLEIKPGQEGIKKVIEILKEKNKK